MRYPHTCTINRTAETISATGGVPVVGTTTQIYSGKCDVQENSRQFNIQNGFIASKGSANIFLPNNIVQAKGIKADDDISITWANGHTQSARVENTSNLDDTLLVLYS